MENLTSVLSWGDPDGDGLPPLIPIPDHAIITHWDEGAITRDRSVIHQVEPSLFTPVYPAHVIDLIDLLPDVPGTLEGDYMLELFLGACILEITQSLTVFSERPVVTELFSGQR